MINDKELVAMLTPLHNHVSWYVDAWVKQSHNHRGDIWFATFEERDA
eukprot:CAMPEP_0119335512 /NCGR_PEP_ID=MMETSP1333-20130426/89752_1 /TAXON_ID=418940 /ORGANISM="Scyphosphaera apsteinii, Strain RCC1455" /LENGTH=46 /DNA_ID= /DNA_START= /DNA_END= /DNA_ORIENTATION=